MSETQIVHISWSNGYFVNQLFCLIYSLIHSLSLSPSLPLPPSPSLSLPLPPSPSLSLPHSNDLLGLFDSTASLTLTPSSSTASTVLALMDTPVHTHKLPTELQSLPVVTAWDKKVITSSLNNQTMCVYNGVSLFR